MFKKSNIEQFITIVESKTNQKFNGYHSLWQWSINNISDFWSLVWDYCEILGIKKDPIFIEANHMINTKWFINSKLNYSENLLRFKNNTDAIVFWGEDKVQTKLTHNELYIAVAKCQESLLNLGLRKNDVVAAYLPNMPETIIAMLATTALGAIWSSASPDFGVDGAVDRFTLIKPKVFFCANGYFYKNKVIDKRADNEQIVKLIPSIRHTIVVRYTQSPIKVNKKISEWNELINKSDSNKISFTSLPFNHPLFIMFSSGTTGAPKAIVHSAGGTLIQHMKEHKLHCDIKDGDRLFYFTTCGWMMWNWLVTGLASGATLLLYDGNPFINNNNIIFNYAEKEKITHLGTSAKFIENCCKNNVSPKNTHNLDNLRIMLSTGSPLSARNYDYIYQNIKNKIAVFSISGGTDIISCFVLGCPILPIIKGELQCRGLGMSVDVFDENGKSIRNKKGELVCTLPFPSMPIKFLNDTNNTRYLESYFTKFINIWCHGDFVKLTKNNGLIIYGRSDTVLNPKGVRIGTAEIYKQVEYIDEVLESVVVGKEKDDDVLVILFVKLREKISLDKNLITKIKTQILIKTSHNHVPYKIIQVPDIPKTKNGKTVEIAVKNIINGKKITNAKSLENPESLDYFSNLKF